MSFLMPLIFQADGESQTETETPVLPPISNEGGFSPVLAVFLFLILAVGGLVAFLYNYHSERALKSTNKPKEFKKVSKKKLERERRMTRSQPMD